MAATYYVATNGNDSNAGTSVAPFLTLQEAANTAVAGDTVVVQDGTYNNAGAVTGGDGSCCNYSAVTLYNSGNANSWITFKAANKWRAILDCMNLCDSYFNLANASYIVIQDFVITHGYKEAIHSNDAAHNITLRGNRLEYIANRSTSTPLGLDGMYTNPNCHDFIIDRNEFHDVGRTDVNWLDHGLYLHGSNFTVTNIIFYNIPHGWSIQAADGLSNVLIANNTFSFPNGGGQDAQIMLWNTQTGLTIRNNIFYNPQNYAIVRYTSSVSSCSIDHNLVYGASGVMADTSGCSVGTNQVGANPLFANVSAAPFDFHVLAGGPGIDAGQNIDTVTVDFDGVNRPQGSSTDQGAYEYAAPTLAPPVISAVSTSAILPNSAIVSWSTDQPASSYVQYGPLSYTNTTPTNSTLLTVHSVTLSNLAPSSVYHFRAGSANSSGGVTLSSDYTLTTAASPLGIAAAAESLALSIAQGQSGTDAITATLVSGLPFPVSFSASSVPTGVSAAFSSTSCMATCTTTLTLSAAAASAPGVYNVAVTAAGSGVSASTTIALTIAASAANITSGLAAGWTMTDGAGTQASDSSGNGNTATLYNPTWWSSNYGITVWFSGANSYGLVNENPSLEMTNQLTVSFWVRPSTNSNTDPRVISKLYDWDVKLNGSNRYPQFTAAGQYATLQYPLPLITWHHVVFTFTTGVVKGYIDGAPVRFLANTFTGTETLAQWMYGLFLATDASKTNSFIGSLDDVRIYNRALSGTEVSALYAALPKKN
jgi:hypothetical protein